MKNKIKKTAGVLVIMLLLLVLAIVIAFARLSYITNGILTEYSQIYDEPKYQNAVSADGVGVITQEVSCGYAVIEMFSGWAGNDITEESLYETYGKVVTSTGASFCEEMNRQFPEYTTTMYRYLESAELIDRAYDSLADGVPVPFEWAAKDGEEWTLHYSLMTGMDIPNDRITVANPYGYIEELTVQELLERTSFQAYENMPLFYRLGFAFGVFEKNTVFIVVNRN